MEKPRLNRGELDVYVPFYEQGFYEKSADSILRTITTILDEVHIEVSSHYILQGRDVIYGRKPYSQSLGITLKPKLDSDEDFRMRDDAVRFLASYLRAEGCGVEVEPNIGLSDRIKHPFRLAAYRLGDK